MRLPFTVPDLLATSILTGLTDINAQTIRTQHQFKRQSYSPRITQIAVGRFTLSAIDS